MDALDRHQDREEPPHCPASEQPAATLHWAPEAVNLTGLPAELLQRMRSAVQDGEKDRLDQLVAEVAKYDSRTAPGLKELVDKYEYDTLTALLAEASK